MTYLLDTHALIWFLENDPQLPQTTFEERRQLGGGKVLSQSFVSPGNRRYISENGACRRWRFF